MFGTKARNLHALVADEVITNSCRTIVLRVFDKRTNNLARSRALNFAIKLLEVGVSDRILLETNLGGGATQAEVIVKSLSGRLFK